MRRIEHLAKANFDLRSRKNGSLTMEMNYLVHLEQAPPHETVFSCHLGPLMTWRLYGIAE